MFPTLFLAIILGFLPITRFFWDAWSQYVLFLIVSTIAALSFVIPAQAGRQTPTDSARIHGFDSEKYAFERLNRRLLDFRLRGNDNQDRQSFGFILLAAFILLWAISAFYSPFKESVRIQGIQLYCAIIGCWAAGMLSLNQKALLQKIFCITVCIFSGFYWITYITPILPSDTAREFFLNANVAASLMIFGFFCALDLMERQKIKLLPLFTIILSFAALIITKSTAGFLGLMIGLCFVVRTYKDLLKHKKIIAGIGLVLAGGTVFMASNGFFDGSFSDRFRWWQSAVQMILNHPFFGFGPGSFEKMSPYFTKAGLKSPYAHSFPIQMAAEIGLPAMIVFWSYIILRLRQSNRSWIIAGLIAVMIQNLVDFSLHIAGIFFLFWFFLGLCSEAVKISDSSPAPSPHPAKAGSRAGVHLIYTFLLALCAYTTWIFAIKPLAAFQESLNAQQSFDKMDFITAENHLRAAIKWDPLPAKIYSDLAGVLLVRYQTETNRKNFFQDAVQFQKEALKREPMNLFYLKQMQEILKGVHSP